MLVEGLHNRQIDICAWFMPKDAHRFGVTVCRSPGGEEQTVIGVDLREQVLFIDTHALQRNPGSADRGEGPPCPTTRLPSCEEDGGMLLRVLADNSIVETFAGGTQAMRRMYPTRTDSDMISYWAEGGTCELDTAATEVKRTNHH